MIDVSAAANPRRTSGLASLPFHGGHRRWRVGFGDERRPVRDSEHGAEPGKEGDQGGDPFRRRDPTRVERGGDAIRAAMIDFA